MTTRIYDHTGLTYCDVTVLSRIGKTAMHTCQCKCGIVRTIDSWHFKGGITFDCGCATRRWVVTHGMAYTDIYHIWSAMKARCNNPKCKGYRSYGATGIKVCDEWQHDFMAFYNHIGPRPTPAHTLDRINPYGNYEPGNVRWATWDVQIKNKRKRSLIKRIAGGRSQP